MLRSVLAVAVLSAALLVSAPWTAAADECGGLTRPPAVAEGRVPPLDQLACADLHGINLLQEDLAGVDMHGSNLSGATLLQADLTKADLHGANLMGVDLRQAKLIGADLSGADLSYARVTQADLSSADLRNAIVTSADLIQATLSGADVRGTDLSSANLTGAVLDGPPSTPEEIAPRESATPADSVAEPVAEVPAAGMADQFAWVLFWPAVALALLWWRYRFGHLLRHRRTTPVRAVDVVAAASGVALVVAGLYLVPVGAVRGLADLAGGAGWTTDPGPLGWLAASPKSQLIAGAVALVLGAVDLLMGQRRPRRDPSATVGQVAIGKPSPARLGPEFSVPVRRVAAAVMFAAVIDFVVVLAVLLFGTLPSDGVWQQDTAIGHLVFVAVAVVVLFRIASNRNYGQKVEVPSGAVIVAGVREPFLWLSGKSKNDEPVSQSLPWESLEHLHLIRILGTDHPATTMLTIRHPGADHASEYPKELYVTPDQVTALRTLLPTDMITEHTRAPSSN